MAFTYTSDVLISSIKTRGRVPSSQSTFTNARILQLCNEEIKLWLLPRLMKAQENFYLFEHSLPIVSGQSKYRIPNRAVGGRIATPEIVDSNGNAKQLPYIDYSDKRLYRDGS